MEEILTEYKIEKWLSFTEQRKAQSVNGFDFIVSLLPRTRGAFTTSYIIPVCFFTEQLDSYSLLLLHSALITLLQSVSV